MKVRKLLELQSTIEERKVPSDMNGDLNKHYLYILFCHFLSLVVFYSLNKSLADFIILDIDFNFSSNNSLSVTP